MYHRITFAGYPLVYLGGNTHCESEVCYPRTQHIGSGQALKLDHLTEDQPSITPRHLPNYILNTKIFIFVFNLPDILFDSQTKVGVTGTLCQFWGKSVWREEIHERQFIEGSAYQSSFLNKA